MHRSIVLSMLMLAAPAAVTGADDGIGDDGGTDAAAPVTITRRELPAAGGATVVAESGRLVVPEVRGDPQSRTIELAFVRLLGTSARPAAPIVYLAGGPGNSATWQADEPEWLANWLPLLDVCDVILLDQRGTGSSQPDLRYRWDGPPPVRFFADEGFALEHVVEMSRKARAAIVARGIDPSGYTSIESADDVDDLRRALGLERISLLGFSYGTHLGLAVLRRHGASIENAVLVGVEGPDHTRKLPLMLDLQLHKLAALAARDPEIGPRVPDLVALLDKVLDKLARQPVLIPIEDGDGNRFELPVGPFGLQMILRRDIGDASDLPVFPRLLHDIDKGDLRTLTWFVRKRAGGGSGMHGMGMLVDGASNASPARWAAIAAQAERSRFGNVMNFPFPEAMTVWRPEDVGDAFRAPLASDVRTLFLSGSLDWNAPPHQAEEVRWGFSDATHLIVDGAGHEQILPHPDIQRAIVRFLRGEDVAGLRPAYPPLRFVPLEGFDPQRSHPSVPPETTSR